MKGQLKKNMDYKNMKSKRILAGMLALLLASGTAPVNFGSALTTDAAIAWGIEPDAENTEAGSSDEDKGDGISEDTISSDDETEAVTADEDNTVPNAVNDYEENGSSDENVDETTDQETTDQETADDETTADETSDAETTDEETTAEETTDDIFIIISTDTAIPLGAYVITEEKLDLAKYNKPAQAESDNPYTGR